MSRDTVKEKEDELKDKAKDIVCANNIDLGNPELDFRLAIKYADKLIEQLKAK